MWSYILDYVIIFLCIGKIDAREKNEKREKQRRFGLFQIVMFGIYADIIHLYEYLSY